MTDDISLPGLTFVSSLYTPTLKGGGFLVSASFFAARFCLNSSKRFWRLLALTPELDADVTCCALSGGRLATTLPRVFRTDVFAGGAVANSTSSSSSSLSTKEAKQDLKIK